MAMGKKPAARQASPMWVHTGDLPTSSGHPFFERLNRILAEFWVRRVRRRVVRGVLRGAAGPSEPAAGSVFPVAVHRLFRGAVFGARDCVAGVGFAESAVVSGPGSDRGVTGPLDAVADAPADRRGDARGGVHVGAGAGGGSGTGAGEDGRSGCDDAGSERGDAKYRAARYWGIVRGVRAAPGGGIGDCNADACGVGAVRPVPEGQDDVEQGVAVAPGSGREGREDEGWPDAPGPQDGARGRPGDGSHPLGDRNRMRRRAIRRRFRRR